MPTGRWEVRTFDESDFIRWQIASHKENGRNKEDASLEKLNYANPNYTSWKGGIDPEFARAKAIRHGLKKLGTNANEKYANKINPVVFNKVEIDEEKDNAAATEETPITPHEEVADTTAYQVTTVEVVEVQNAPENNISKLNNLQF